LGGGVVPGSAVLVGGEPGVGKSTLLLDVASRAAAAGRRVLYVSGEESMSQVAARAGRIGANHPGLLLSSAALLGEVLGLVERERPDLLVVDSIQTVGCAEVDGTPGGVTLVRAVTGELVAAAKAGRMACLLVGHVTKDGSVAGPRTIEHLVDAVLLFEGDQGAALRWLRSTKNRFGAADEVGCFQMAQNGIKEVPDPSGLLLEDLEQPVPGACAGITLDGRRPMAVSVQALAAKGAEKGRPVRAAMGLESGRLAMVLAVLQARADVGLGGMDVYVSTAGGVKCPDPAMDLPLALACASARFGVVVPGRTAAVGEIGLGGQIRQTPGMGRRLAEAGRLGFTRAVVPASAKLDKTIARTGLRLVPVKTLREAVNVLLEQAAQEVRTV
jgi:DNA repair protein RadA/Sms